MKTLLDENEPGQNSNHKALNGGQVVKAPPRWTSELGHLTWSLYSRDGPRSWDT